MALYYIGARMAESTFSEGPSSPPVVKMQTPPGVNPWRIFLNTGF